MLGRLLGTGCVRTFNILHWPAVVYSTQVVVPSLGESITDGSIAAVLKAAGDPVKENETIAQIETDKVTIDIKAPCDGTVLGIVVQEQETVVPGQLVATLDDAPAKVCGLKRALCSEERLVLATIEDLAHNAHVQFNRRVCVQLSLVMTGDTVTVVRAISPHTKGGSTQQPKAK